MTEGKGEEVREEEVCRGYLQVRVHCIVLEVVRR